MTHDIKYRIRKWDMDGKFLFDIEGDDLVYADFGGAHGVQCNHMGGTPEHEEILKLCGEIADRFKQIDVLNKKA